MNVLLMARGLFQRVGGGETVYERIIKYATSIDFFYFVENGSKVDRSDIPPNAHMVFLKPVRSIKVLMPPPFPQYEREALIEADQYAYSVKNMTFDIVDIPDYYSFGSMLRTAFKYNNVYVDRVVLALHGSLSVSLNMNWTNQDVEQLKCKEMEQFRTADYVYSISPFYMNEWKQKYFRQVAFIDPMNFVDYSQVFSIEKNEDKKVNIFCVGRSERRKGNDIFIEMMRWINPSFYNKCTQIGDIDFFSNGVSSEYYLNGLAMHRNMEFIRYEYSKNKKELCEIFHERSFILIPTRYDSLNLIVLEAIFSGCPVAVSDRAGVCEYLDTIYPDIPYIKIDFDKMADSLHRINDYLKNYDINRELLRESLKKYSISLKTQMEIEKMYYEAKTEEMHENKEMVQYLAYSSLERFLSGIMIQLPIKLTFSKYFNRENLKLKPISIISKLLGIDSIRYLNCTNRISSIMRDYFHISQHPENNIDEIVGKMKYAYYLADASVFRINAYYEVARLQSKMGHTVIENVFLWRCMRLLNQYDCESLTKLKTMIIENGFEFEEEVVELLYGKKRSAEMVYKYLHNERKRLLTNNVTDDYIFIKDVRSEKIPKISIIVSMYNAENKLEYFISMLMKQTLLPKGEIEIIFIDSYSPTKEKEIVNKYIDSLNYLYVRTNKRETIQTAWNRGIKFARGTYLSFLGVDEMLYPDALEVLLEELESNPDIDWVMGDSIIESVEMNGLFNKEVMMYQRKGLSKPLVYLECCYLSYVGGLYRKDIHDRFGYYDSKFRGAGDTEFKDRILPYINIKHIERTLGIFLNYPEVRTTESPMAEIEDMKAYYVYKSLGGIRYTYENCSNQEIEQAFILAIGYRKSYCYHTSTDLEYAINIAKYYMTRDDQKDSLIASLLPLLERVMELYQELEFTPYFPKVRETKWKLIRNYHEVKNIERKVQMYLGERNQIDFSLFNDNRWEQHIHLWGRDDLI